MPVVQRLRVHRVVLPVLLGNHSVSSRASATSRLAWQVRVVVLHVVANVVPMSSVLANRLKRFVPLTIGVDIFF